MNDSENSKPSLELQTFMEVNKIHNLEELLVIPDEVLVDMPGFGWNLLKEILLLRKIQ